MPDFYFQIFPQGSLADSVATTVWIGACILCFFNLRFGWVLSGLVVPGYLVPLLMSKPWSALVIFVEGVITYFLVWFSAEYLSRFRLWGSFFGRDRFFALLLVSVFIKVLLETFFLPTIGEFVNQMFQINFDYRNNLHSFGLIIVALIANQFWKPGFFRGLIPLLVSVSMTYLVVRYVLMNFTNFSLGNLIYMYEDLSVSMLASPKAYIILLITAFIASRMNLKYGWEYNGILIPALLALQWYQPFKILTTIVESLVILLAAVLLLRLPIFKNATIEGARKILLFFNIGFLYKLLVGHILLSFFPDQKISDFYGFGYLLTTLIAIKMHNKKIPVQLTRVTLQTSITALALASIIGFSLMFVPNFFAMKTVAEVAEPPIFNDRSLLVDIVRQDKITLYQSKHEYAFVQPLAEELEIFSHAVRALTGYIKGEVAGLEESAKLLSRVNYRVRLVENQYYYLYELPPRRGWGYYVINAKKNDGLLIQVPSPLDEWGTMQAGTHLFEYLNANAMAIAGTSRKTNPDGSSDVSKNYNTFFKMFQKELGQENTLQVKGHTTSSIRILTGKRQRAEFTKEQQAQSMLWIKTSPPPGLDLARLEELTKPFQIEWGRSPFSNILRDAMKQGHAELIVNRSGMRHLLFKPFFLQDKFPLENSHLSIAGYLQDWLLKNKETIAAKGSNSYRKPSIEELLYFDQEIITPLLALVKTHFRDGQWTPEGLEELTLLKESVKIFGYTIIRYRNIKSNTHYLLLIEKTVPETRRFWGTYVFRCGSSSPYLIQAPKPLSEINVFEYSVALFERLQGTVLLIGGTHPMANDDGTANLVQPENKESLFNLVNQVVLRQAQDEFMLAVQCRAFGLKQGENASTDALIALKSSLKDIRLVDPYTAALINLLEKDGYTLRFVDGSKGTSGYETIGISQARYMDQTLNKEFLTLWLSPLLRSTYYQQTENRSQKAQFDAVGIDTLETDLFDFIQQKKPVRPSFLTAKPLTRDIEYYLKTHDIMALNELASQDRTYRYTRLIDINTKQSFLVVHMNNGHVGLVVNLRPKEIGKIVEIQGHTLTDADVRNFVDSRSSMLELKGP